MSKLDAAVRKACGEEVEPLHDIHERVSPIDAINLIKNVEPYHPYFIEDPFSPENMEWFKQLRATTSVPIAMGELFNNINEFKRSEEHTSELQSRPHLVCRLLLEKK